MHKLTLLISLLLLSASFSFAQTDLAKLSIAELDTLYIQFRRESKDAKALACIQLSAEKTLTQYGEEDSVYVNKLITLTDVLGALRQFQPYEETLVQAMQLEEKHRGKTRAKYFFILERLASLYKHTKRVPQAEELYKQVKEHWASTTGKQSPEYALALSNLGAIAQRKKQYKIAEQYYTEAVEILRNYSNPINIEHIEPFDNLAIIYYQTGQYSKAEKLYQQNISTRNQALPKAPKSLVSSIKNKNLNTANNLAVLYYITGRYAEAEALYLSVIKEKKATAERHPESYTNSLNNLASLYHTMGRYEEAESLHLQALEIRKEKLGISNPKYAQSLNNLALLYSKIERNNDAEKYYLKTLAIYKETIGKKDSKYAITLSNLAGIYMKYEQYKKAQELYAQTLQIQQEALGFEHNICAAGLSNLGDVSAAIKDYAAAQKFYQEALNIYQKKFPIFHPSCLKILNLIAQTYQNQGNTEKAWFYLHSAINQNAHQDSSNTKIDAQWAEKIALADYSSQEELNNSFELVYDLLKQQNNHKQQLIVAKLALKTLEQARNEYHSKEDKLRSLSQSNSWTIKALATLHILSQKDNNMQTEALTLAESNKSVLLKEAAQTRQAHIFGELPDTLAEQEQHLQKELAKNKAALLEAKYANKPLNTLHAQRSQLNQEIDSLGKYIQAHYPKYSNYKSNKTAIDIQGLQKDLDNKTAIIEYVLSESSVYSFYIDKTTANFYKIDIPLKNLDTKIKALRDNFTNTKNIIEQPQQAYEEYSQLAHWFYQELVAPCLVKKSGIKHLVFITDRGLGHLPFESFLVEPANSKEMDFKHLHYLVKDYQISYDYSASLWQENNAKNQQSNGNFLAIAGNYQQQLSDDLVKFRLPYYQNLRKTLGPLKGAKNEVNDLAKIFEGTFITDSLLSESYFKQNADQYGIIHLAMHGILNQKNPLLSSLAFSENGDSSENNFLQAHEISHKQLQAALVVLSACETGYGKFEAGNGIASLARAFMYAGVPSLIVSLWQVNDQSTALIMQNFYKNLADGNDKSTALQKAKLEYLQNIQNPIAKHPAFWSPFVLLGNSQAISINTKNSGNWWWLVFPVLCLGGLGFWKFNR